MSIFKTKPKKLKKGTPCAFCPNVIHLHNEVGGILWVASGKPICTTCRVMRKNPLAKKMQGDAKKDYEQREANKVDDVALNSQLISEADSDKKKALLKRLHNK